MPRYHTIEDPDDEYIWAKMIENEGVEFHTARGLPFTYKIKTNAAGEKLGEMIIDRRGGKTITRGTVVLAYKKALGLGGLVTGPKKLGVFGASYIYPVFVEIGVCRKPNSNERNRKAIDGKETCPSLSMAAPPS